MGMSYLTEKDIDNRINKRWDNEYVRVGEYTKINKRILVKHNTCGNTFESFIHGLVNHKSIPCPYCNFNAPNKNTDIFRYQITQKFANEYDVLGEYTKAMDHILIRHNICNTEFYPSAAGLIRGTEKCPYCAKYSNKIDTNIFKRKIFDIYGDEYEILGEYTKSYEDILIKHKCGYEYMARPSYLLEGFNKCPFCTPRTHITHEEYLNIFNEKYKSKFELLDTYSCSYEKLLFKCNECGTKFRKNAYYAISEYMQCDKCGRGISYPEKVFRSVCEQLNVEYIPEYSKYYADWCEKYRYDFYLPYYNYIVEINGMQHYISSKWGNLEDNIKRDEIKKEIALKHVDKYIVIDARESTIEWIKNSIANSELSSIFDLSKIDWLQCHEDGLTTTNSKIYELYLTNEYSVADIAKELNISEVTVNRYIKKYKNAELMSA